MSYLKNRNNDIVGKHNFDIQQICDAAQRINVNSKKDIKAISENKNIQQLSDNDFEIMFRQNDLKCIKLLYVNFIKEKQSCSIQIETIYNYSKVIKKYISFLETKQLKNLTDIYDKALFMEFLTKEFETTNNIYTKKFIGNTIKMFLKYIYEMDLQLQAKTQNYTKEKSITQYEGDFSENIKNNSEKALYNNKDLQSDEVYKNQENNIASEFLKIKDYDFFLKDFKIITPEVKPNLYDQKTLEKILAILRMKKNQIRKRGEGSRLDFFVFRNSLILKLLIYCGVKGEELLGVRLCDIKLSPEGRYFHVYVSRKGRKERALSVSKNKIIAEVDRMNDFLKNIPKDERYVCSTISGKKMHRRDVERMVEKFFTENDLYFIGLQGFKHSYAKKLFEKGYSVQRIRYLLGYRNTTSVLAYKKALNLNSE